MGCFNSLSLSFFHSFFLRLKNNNEKSHQQQKANSLIGFACDGSAWLQLVQLLQSLFIQLNYYCILIEIFLNVFYLNKESSWPNGSASGRQAGHMAERVANKRETNRDYGHC